MVATYTRKVHIGAIGSVPTITTATVFDIAQALDSLNTTQRRLLSAVDSAMGFDTNSRTTKRSLTAADAAAAFDAVIGKQSTYIRAAMDVAVANEGLNQFIASHRGASDTAVATEQITRAIRLARSSSDSAGASDVAVGNMSTSLPPAKELWQPAEIRSTALGTQVGPNGQYAVHKIAIGSLQSQTAAGFASGNLIFSTANQIIIGVKFTGVVTVTAANVTFYSCEFDGSQTTASQLVVCTSGLISGIKFYDCFFNPTLINNGNGLIGGNYTAWRCEIWRTIDGFGPRNPGSGAQPNNANAYHYNCYVHDLCADLTDGGQKRNGVAPGPCHSDCCQFQGGNNMEIIGCTFRGFVDPTFGDGATWNASTATSGNSSATNVREFGPNFQNNSCLQTNQNTGIGITSGVKVSYNDFDGGIFTINIGAGSHGNTIIDECIHNRFGHNQGGWANDGHGWTGVSTNNGGNSTYCFAPNSSSSSITNYLDNVYKDNGVAVNSRGY